MKELINVSNEYDVFIQVYTNHLKEAARYRTGGNMKEASNEALEFAKHAFDYVNRDKDLLAQRGIKNE